MAKPSSSQPRGVLGRLEQSSRAKESTSKEADGHDQRGEEEHNSTITPTALTATQKKNKKRRAKKKNAPADDVVVLEMSHLAQSNEVPTPLYEFYGTNHHAIAPRAGAHGEALEEYMRAYRATAPTGKSKTQTMASHTNGGEIATQREQEMAQVIADGHEDLDGLPVTDLYDVENHEAWIHGLGAPWDGLLNRSIQATEVLKLRKKFCKGLTHPEIFGTLVRQQGEDVAHAIREELAIVVAASEERERAFAVKKQLEVRSCDQIPTPVLPEWIPNIKLFHDVDSLEGSSNDIVYDYHRPGKDGKWEWKPANPPIEQTKQQVGGAGVLPTDDPPAPTILSICATHDGDNAHHPARHGGHWNQAPNDVSTHRLDSSGSCKPSPIKAIKQNCSRIPAPSNGLGSKRKGGGRQSGPDSTRDVQDMLFLKASGTSEIESIQWAEMCVQPTDARDSATTMPSREPCDVAESMVDTSEESEIRSEAERARLEAELDALIEDWRPVKPATQRPMPGSAEMAQIVEDIFEPLRRRCTATMNEHRNWLDDWRAERDAEQVEDVDSSANPNSDEHQDLLDTWKAECEAGQFEDPDPSVMYPAAVETMIANARAMTAPQIVSWSAFGRLGTKGKERLTSGGCPQGLAAFESKLESFQPRLEAVRENHKAKTETYAPVRVTLLSEAKTEEERKAGELAAAQRRWMRAGLGDNEAEYVHPYVDRSYSAARPHPEQRILAMKKEGLESLTDKLCRMGSLKEKADAQKLNKALSLAQNATQKSVASKKVMNQIVSWE